MVSEKASDEHLELSSVAASQNSASKFDLYSYHEQRAGRLIIDPAYVSDFIIISSRCMVPVS